eukprot:4425475-Amphidinium_carterae.1
MKNRFGSCFAESCETPQPLCPPKTTNDFKFGTKIVPPPPPQKFPSAKSFGALGRWRWYNFG